MTKSIKSLKPADYNPRKISDKQLELLDKSIKEFGDLSGIVFNVATNKLVGGHQRIKSFNQESIIQKEPFQDETGTTALGYVITSEGKFSYREVNWTEQKEKAANISANKNGGEWDFTKLKDLIEELDDGQFDLELTGFDTQEIENLMTYVPNDDKDYSDKNKEIDLDSFEDVMEFKLKFNKDDYLDIQDKFNILKDKFKVSSNEDVLKELILFHDRT